jgi:FtsH-binding integral membrane protein
MKNTSFKFLGFLAILMLVAFGIHLFALSFTDHSLLGYQIILSYVVNYLLAAVVLIVVEKTLNKNSAQAGFVFMAGSALKFLVFFLVFYPIYKADDEMQAVEFATFFIPYAICLITEVIYLSKQLNNQ